jgi:hypothetical protein
VRFISLFVKFQSLGTDRGCERQSLFDRTVTVVRSKVIKVRAEYPRGE